MRRFANRALRDTVERVARDPVRKLSPGERLLRAAHSCLEHGVEPIGLAVAAAAAIRYDLASDSASQRLQKTLRDKGLDTVLQDLCGIEPGSPFAALIKQSGPIMTPGIHHHHERD